MNQPTKGPLDDRLARVAGAAQRVAARPAGRQPLRITRTGDKPRRQMPSDKVGIDEPFVYEIIETSHSDVISGKREADDEMVRMIKTAINEAGITRRMMHQFIGSDEGALFNDTNQAYNLEYGLRLRGTMTLECAKRWAVILNRELKITLEPTPV